MTTKPTVVVKLQNIQEILRLKNSFIKPSTLQVTGTAMKHLRAIIKIMI